MGEPLILKEKAVAEMLGVHPGTLRYWRSKRVGPAWVMIGEGPRPRPYYLLSDIHAYLRSKRTDPNAAPPEQEVA